DLGFDEVGGDVEALLAKTGLVGGGVGAVTPPFGCWAMPDRERILKHTGRRFDGSRSECVAAKACGVGEAMHVDVVALPVQPVAATHRDDDVGVAETTTQP